MVFDDNYLHLILGSDADILYKKFTREHYKGWAAALMSASYGYFQILRENYNVCGFDNEQDFVKAMQQSGAKQIDALAKFLKSKGIQDDINDENWKNVAEKYNGALYKENNYDTKLEKAYEKHSK